MEPKEDKRQGQWFSALDERTGQPVEVFVFNRDLVSDAAFLGALRTQAELALNVSHPLLRAVQSLEANAERTFLVEEPELGLSLQDLLRTRQHLTPSEVAILPTGLAPWAEPPQLQGL